MCLVRGNAWEVGACWGHSFGVIPCPRPERCGGVDGNHLKGRQVSKCFCIFVNDTWVWACSSFCFVIFMSSHVIILLLNPHVLLPIGSFTFTKQCHAHIFHFTSFISVFTFWIAFTILNPTILFYMDHHAPRLWWIKLVSMLMDSTRDIQVSDNVLFSRLF